MDPKVLHCESAAMVAPETWPGLPDPTRPPLPSEWPRTLRIGHNRGGKPVKMPGGLRSPKPRPSPPQ